MNRIIIPTITYRHWMRDIFMPYRHLIPINDRGAQPGPDAGAANQQKPNDDGVVDADFKEV